MHHWASMSCLKNWYNILPSWLPPHLSKTSPISSFRLLHLCHGVLYKQLASWMLHGMLLDTYGEFFVQRRQVKTSQPTTTSPEEDDLGLSGITTKHIQRIVVSLGCSFGWCFKIKTVFPVIEIPIIMMRRSWDCLISMMGVSILSIPERWCLYDEMVPCYFMLSNDVKSLG